MVVRSGLSADILKQAKEELNEDPKRRQQDIEHIRQWLSKQPHIKVRADDWKILRFLRGCKFSLERTKEKIDIHYTCRTMIPEWFDNRDPRDTKLIEIMDTGVFLPLPGYDDKGRKVIITRAGLTDPHKVSMDDVLKVCYMIVDILADEDEQFSVTGIVNIMDTKQVTKGHMLQFTLPLMKKCLLMEQEGNPMRQKGMHYVNTPPVFEAVFNVFKGFMKEKLKKRIHMHSNLESLHESIPKKILPKEYGGDNASVDEIKDYWKAKLEERRDWLLESEKFKVDESKRPGRPKTKDDFFGIDGSFRKLDVD